MTATTTRRIANKARTAASRPGASQRQLTDLIHAVKDELFHLIHAVKNEMSGRIEQASEATTEELVATNRRITRIGSQVAEVHAAAYSPGGTLEVLGALQAKMDWLLERDRHSILTGGGDLEALSLADVDGPLADLLNFAGSHRSPLREQGLWVNHPTVIEWRDGSAALGAVNERIVEQPFVLAALGGLPAGARVIDIGGGESLIGLSLASLGLDVTVLEPAGYPFTHPNLRVSLDRLEDAELGDPFDAAVLLSTIEHFGIGHYGDQQVDDADLKAANQLLEAVRPGGILALTTPYGVAETTEVERIYDEGRLRALLEGWDIERIQIARRNGQTEWGVISDSFIEPEQGQRYVAMVVARRP